MWCGNERCEERDASGNVTKRFFHRGAQIGSENYFFVKDHLGSTRALTDMSSNLVAQYAYSPFGEQTTLRQSVASDFGFAGMYVHQRSGLNLTLARAYSPSLGRWLSRDPLGEGIGSNLYAYCFNNPVSLKDPLGTDALGSIVFGGIGAGLGGVILGGGGAVGGTAFAPGVGTIAGGAGGWVEGSAIGGAAGATIGAGVPLGQAVQGIGQGLNNIGQQIGNILMIKPTPVQGAEGEHTTWVTNPEGNITHHDTWTPNPQNPSGWDSVQHTDVVGRPHYDKPSQTYVPTPHTQGKDWARPATPSECPTGKYKY